MRTRRIAAVVAVTSCLALAVTAVAQDPASRGPGAGPRRFDPSTVTTVTGRVQSVERYQRGRGQGVHLLLEGDLDVVLGPAWYLDRQAVKVGAGDTIEVTGSRVQWGSRSALVAQSVKKDGQALTLRDASGSPAWRGQGPGRTGPGPQGGFGGPDEGGCPGAGCGGGRGWRNR